MQAAITHILSLTMIRRKRLLPVPGKVLVHEGQKVAAADVLAEAPQAGQYTLVDVRRELGLSRIDQTEALIQLSAGSLVQQGDLLAQTPGLFGHAVRSPVSGRVVAVTSGRLLIETPGEPLRLLAGTGGMVDEVIPDYGAVIETGGALIQGRLGNQRTEMGVLINHARTTDDELTLDRMDISLRGAIVLAGHCRNPEVLRVGNTLPLRGLILSSITADMLPVLREAHYPVIVIEGIGRIPYNREAFQILTTNERRDTCIQAMYDAQAGERPEIIIPLPAIGGAPRAAAEFAPGQTVRILAAPYAAQVGVLVQIRPGQTRLINGLFAPAAEVRLPNEVVIVPLANLDVLE